MNRPSTPRTPREVIHAPSITPTLWKAMRYLAGMDTDRAHQRNGVGFSAADSTKGNRVADRIYWTRAHVDTAIEYVQRYRRQLTAANIAWATGLDEGQRAWDTATTQPALTLAAPTTPAPPPPAAVVQLRCVDCGDPIERGRRCVDCDLDAIYPKADNPPAVPQTARTFSTLPPLRGPEPRATTPALAPAPGVADEDGYLAAPLNATLPGDDDDGGVSFGPPPTIGADGVVQQGHLRVAAASERGLLLPPPVAESPAARMERLRQEMADRLEFETGVDGSDQAEPDDTAVPEPAISPAIVAAPVPVRPYTVVPLRPTGAARAAALLGAGGPLAAALPNYTVRDPQLEITTGAETAIRAGHHLAGEAGTGTGKSFAYLVPAIVAAEELGYRTIVSTADKALQGQLRDKDLPFLQQHLGIPFTWAVLKGRKNYLCRHKAEEIRTENTTMLPGFAEAAAFPSLEAAEAWPLVDRWERTTEAGDFEEIAEGIPNDLRDALSVTSDECLGEKCPLFTSCFVERAKQRAKVANIVVVNHALLLRDLAIRDATGGMAALLPDADVVVLDEGHHLEEQATDAFGFEITQGQWNRMRKQLEKLTTKHKGVRAAAATSETAAIAEALDSAADAITLAIRDTWDVWERRMQREDGKGEESTVKLGDELPVVRPLVELLGKLSTAMADAEPVYLSDVERSVWSKLVERIDRYTERLEILAAPDPTGELVRYLQRDGRVLVATVKPVEVAAALRAALWTKSLRRPVRGGGQDEDLTQEPRRPVIGIVMSATLATTTGFRHFRERVGLDEAAEILVPAPFDYPTAARLYLPPNADAFDPTQKRNPQSERAYYDMLAQEVLHLSETCTAGGVFALFASFRALSEVYDRIGHVLRRQRLVLRQERGGAGLPRPELLRQFVADGHAILFGVKSFWEGVDVQGDALSMVIIDAFPFAPPTDPVWAAKTAKLTERRKAEAKTPAEKRDAEWAWFNELAVPAAVIALKQGVGRLIRTASDRGVFAILDGRAITKAYGPRVLRALPPARQVRSLQEVAAFYADRE